MLLRLLHAAKWARYQIQKRRKDFAPSRLISSLNGKQLLKKSAPDFFSHVQAQANYKGFFIQEPIIDWSYGFYQRPQHLCRELGMLGYLTIYQSPPFGRDPDKYFLEIEKNVWITKTDITRKLPRATHSFYSGVDNLLSIRRVKKNGGHIIYEYVDKIDTKISGSSRFYNTTQVLLNQRQYCLEHAEHIVCTAQSLYDEVLALGRPASSVHLIPNGVQFSHFENISHSTPQPYLDFIKSKKMIVGYFGAMAPWLWYNELNKLIAARNDVGFVFIGSDFNGASQRLINSPNIYRAGHVDYDYLPAYAQHFDVCLIPFEPGEIAQTTSPLKLFEYFALGKPVVVTSDMRECVRHKNVFPASNFEDFHRQIDIAFKASQDPIFVSETKKVARENDWKERAKQMAALISN